MDFAYGEKPVLQDINLTVKSGQLVALVGASGSGKTTLANLLLRFYDPTRGAIKIGGVDLRDVPPRAICATRSPSSPRKIFCSTTPSAGTSNWAASARRTRKSSPPRATPSPTISSCKKTEGFDTVIGEKGVSLSGGQRQRLAIARAVLTNAPILVLDEATSALDTESERAVQAALDELMKGRTTICIAHRLSTILHADLIVVLDQGRIVETGTHAELARRGGVYQKLYELQFLT